jgi:DNA-binding CsgD family transcriptional regulator
MSDPKDGEGLTDEEAAGGQPDSGSDPDDGPRVSRMRVGGEEIIVLSVPLPKLRYPEHTTEAEHEIIDLVLEGLTAKEIAERRGASLRTVTTQLGAIFRKADVNSQAELIAMMTEGGGDEDDA